MRKLLQQEDCQQRKKPRTESPETKKGKHNSLLTIRYKRKENQDQYIVTRSNNNVKTAKMTEQ
eukprot:3548953-Heterocapsa_arctica.AAC.1